jgi:hypothetical protein
MGIEGVDKVIVALNSKLARKGKYGNAVINVGYRAYYAIYVHENLEAYHPIGQAKFLETPLRRNREKYARMVRSAMARGESLGSALAIAGQELLEDSQALVPYDTGFLHDSGFVSVAAK